MKFYGLVAIAAAAILIGCGGGGSSSSGLSGDTAGGLSTASTGGSGGSTTGSTTSTSTTGALTTGTSGSTTAGTNGTTTGTTGTTGSTTSSTGTTGTSTTGTTTGGTTGATTGGTTGTSTSGTTTGGTTGSTGGTTGTTTGGTTGSAQGPVGVTVVATDNSTDTTTDPMDAYSSATVTVHEIDLIGSAGTVVVFSDSVGQSFDLKQLQDPSGPLFAFLSHSTVPFGTYTSVRIVLDSAFSAVLASNGSTVTLHMDPSLSIGGGQSAITYTLGTPLVVTGGEQVIAVDFNVNDWPVDGSGTVSPVVDSGSTTGVSDPSRQIAVQMPGWISELVKNTSFKLKRGGNALQLVLLSNTTTVTGGKGASLDSLANYQHIILTAAWNETSRSLAARSIKVTGH